MADDFADSVDFQPMQLHPHRHTAPSSSSSSSQIGNWMLLAVASLIALALLTQLAAT